MESKEGSIANQERHHTGANNSLHSEYKIKDASHHRIHIWSTRTTESRCHCLQDISTEIVTRQTTMWWTTSCSYTTRKDSSATDHSQTITHQDQQKGHLCQCYQHSNTMDSATAVNEPMEPVCTFAPQTTTTDLHVNFCAPLQRWHHWNN